MSGDNSKLDRDELVALRRSAPSWLSWANLAAGVQVAMVVGGIGFWAVTTSVTTSNKADSTALALAGVNSRLDRIFEKLDAIPIIQERLAQTRAEVIEAKGAYASLETRLRAIESNVSAVHEEATKPGPRPTR